MWWMAAAAAGGVAIAAGVGDWRRSKRRDLDSIGWVDWRTLQMFALIAAACCAIVATHLQ
ncbi:hypothetical protein [Sphingomonas sp. HMP6]|uniref:hypothetical protein n=1 Tax=Sphingomonas sp. HMP6 TaxID=1517551 RepID=UPI001596A682|nr:hypothetical protein [Sphingomonas sp. HMP6]BCA58897.1 hypothetical protein HMP06_1666 [Sphingomonas sp. HMP6]